MPTKQKIKIVIVDKINLDSLYLFNKNKFEVIQDFGISNEEILKKYCDCDVLIIRSVRFIDKNFISKCKFKIIATNSKGFDNIDCAAANRKKITVLNIDKGNSVSAAEHTMGLILCAMKNIIHSDKLVRSGKFNEYNFRRSELAKKRIGIIGYGHVGSHVGKLCKAFGMKVYANDINKKVIGKNINTEFKPLNFILKNCDIVTLHIPLNKNNFHFIDKKKLDALRKNCVLVNTSRGSVIDEEELIKKLKRNELRCVCLDVFENEPYPSKEFFQMKNVILTNHTAGKTEESAVKMSKELFEKVIKFFSKN